MFITNVSFSAISIEEHTALTHVFFPWMFCLVIYSGPSLHYPDTSIPEADCQDN